jgi:glucose-6-phosphate isomerase
VHPLVEDQLSAMENFVNQLHSGSIRGFSGKPITHIVNIGIGGSDLGPAMAAEALTPFRVPGFKVDFVSNVDGAHIRNVLRNCKPETTLFIIASKTFTTQETMMNAHSARQWFLDETQTKPEHVSLHFAAISTNIKLATQFGIRKDYIFGFEDWVGGRYSVWSSIGLSLACYIGFEQFRQFLAGAAAADKHFRNTPYEKNIPVIMALLGIWYRNFLNAESHAILPYYQNLWKFPEWLQQVDMESNGKCVDRNGNRVNYATGPIIWGAPGTNGQHAFFQLLHQGTSLIPCDFIGMVHPLETCPKHHQVLLSNFIAQTEALLCGKTLEEVKEEMKASGRTMEDIAFIAPHRVFEGNKPSTTILVPQFDPYYLGMLMAFYEHKVFVQGIIWNIFSFDQWGVELGKVLAGKVLTELQAEQVHASRDSGTAGIMHYVYKQSRN